ncbi:MAG: plastocyanin/azurin family copper-binding protein [Salinisphaera sp.]|jgi:azurin|nr:plastocyanin/azurin family copper-binding protein [Salinisphaera sp.]
MLKKTVLVVAALVLGLSAVAAQAAANFTIEGTNALRFSKEHLTVAPGEKVTIKLVNKSNLPASAMAHNWILLKADADPDIFDRAAMRARSDGYFPKAKSDEVIAHTALVAGGHSDTVTFTAPDKPGDYEYICSFPGHLAAGMKGVLTVSKSG